MIDLESGSGTLSASDFKFRAGNDNTPGAWAAAPNPSSITVRHGAGAQGSDRVTIVWPDRAIIRKWLQVTVNATPATGLVAPDVFYFGNAIGETGNSTGNALVSAIDEIGARNNPRTFLKPAPLDYRFDFNHDTFVNAFDQIIARNNGTTLFTTLRLIVAPASITSGTSLGADSEDSSASLLPDPSTASPSPQAQLDLSDRPTRPFQRDRVAQIFAQWPDSNRTSPTPLAEMDGELLDLLAQRSPRGKVR
jgi:hypothetical protein